MNDKILQAIKDSLPSIQAKELENFFNLYTKMEKELQETKEKNEDIKKRIEDLEKIDREKYNIEEKHAKLITERNTFEEEKREAKIKELEYKLKCEEVSNRKAIDMLNVIFRNRFFNKSVCGGQTLDNGNYGSMNTYESIVEQEI